MSSESELPAKAPYPREDADPLQVAGRNDGPFYASPSDDIKLTYI